jgi:anaerobic sulfite reductase subunit A
LKWQVTQPEIVQDLASAIENRKEIYAFLARTYASEATIDYLRVLSEKSALFFASAQDPDLAGTDLAEGFKEIAGFASSLKGADLEKVRLDLAVEYAGLFLGVWGKPAHPSESYYLTEGQLIMQQPRDDMLKLYRAMGVEKAGEFKEPEDHIALELQFMAHLCDKTNAALKDGNFKDAKKYLGVQRNFLDEHLGKWVPKLAFDILKSARHEFYRAIAKITKAYVDVDKELVANLDENLTIPSGSDLPSTKLHTQATSRKPARPSCEDRVGSATCNVTVW